LIDDITETNEFIDDTDAARQAMMTQEEIQEMRASGASAEEIMQAQLKRHERFELKTDFSKEKWRKRKEKKCVTSSPAGSGQSKQWVLSPARTTVHPAINTYNTDTPNTSTPSRPRPTTLPRTNSPGCPNPSCTSETTQCPSCSRYQTYGRAGGTWSWTIQAVSSLLPCSSAWDAWAES
jgi:hypothetical protein